MINHSTHKHPATRAARAVCREQLKRKAHVTRLSRELDAVEARIIAIHAELWQYVDDPAQP